MSQSAEVDGTDRTQLQNYTYTLILTAVRITALILCCSYFLILRTEIAQQSKIMES